MEAEESRVVVTLTKKVSALACNRPFQRREANVGSLQLVALTGFMRERGWKACVASKRAMSSRVTESYRDMLPIDLALQRCSHLAVAIWRAKIRQKGSGSGGFEDHDKW